MRCFVFITVMFLISILEIEAQSLLKIEKLYQQAEYQEVIDKAKKLTKKKPNEIEPYYYIALANFGIFKQTTKMRKKYYMQNFILYTKRGLTRDKQREVFAQFNSDFKQAHDSLKNFALQLYYSSDRGSSEFFLKNLAFIFNDTTDEYKELLVQKQKPNKFFQQQLAFKEYAGEINQTDINGKKQGIWIEKYDDGTVKSEILYKDGHPAGVFRLYYPNGRLKANLYFDTSGTVASAILYRDDGSKFAMGYYWNKKKDSLWQYFYNDSIVIAEEHWHRGVKNGSDLIYSIYYYPNVLEEKYWKNGKQDSIYIRYYPWGTPQFMSFYKNGKREGPVNSFNENGKLIVKGFYKNDLPDSVWVYWNDSTQTFDTLIYQHGKLLPEYEEKEALRIKKFMEQKIKFDSDQFFRKSDENNDY